MQPSARHLADPSRIGRVLPATLAVGLLTVACSRPAKPTAATPQQNAPPPAHPERPSLLASHGHTVYQIVVDRSRATETMHAAERLQFYLAKLTGARFPIVTDEAPGRVHEIVVGTSSRVRRSLAGWDTVENAHDGVLVRSEGQTLYVLGGPDRGLRYAVYELLETGFGCRYYFPELGPECPRQPELELPQIALAYVPPLRERDISWMPRAGEHQEFLDWHKSDSDRRGRAKLWVHTFRKLLPAGKYFDQHPEYYALRDGRRTPEQPCLTHPEVKRLVIEELASRMAAHPEWTYWGVSQNDNVAYCQCERCAALDRAAQSHAGAVLTFVNEIAEHFPEKTIGTLAYMYSRKPPVGITPRANVNIMLCSIEADRSHPLALEQGERPFAADLGGWTRLTGNLKIWDYATNFAYRLAPFPILDIVQDNLRLFAKHGVRRVFTQTFRSAGKAPIFGDLRGYVGAKLLWNPALNLQALVHEYLRDVYGAAAPALGRYLAAQEKYLNASGKELGIYQAPSAHADGYLSPDKLVEYRGYFAQALDAVKNDPVRLRRVRSAQIELLYADLEVTRALGRRLGGLYAAGSRLDPRLRPLLSEFHRLGLETEQRAMNERRYRIGDYAKEYQQMLDRMQRPSIARGAPVRSTPGHSPKYPGGGVGGLTDGVFGLTSDHTTGWQGYEKTDVVLTLDLRTRQDIRSVRARFLSNQEAWIFRPVEVALAVSRDGRRFRTLARTKNKLTRLGLKKETWSFESARPASKVRFVRLAAKNVAMNPAWHHSPGGAAWIFVDEISVR